jgi:hypothetical protein
MSEEEYVDDEYIGNENDPAMVEKITNEDYTLIEDEEIISFDKVFETVRAKSVTMTNYDKMMEKKVLNFLIKGEIK